MLLPTLLAQFGSGLTGPGEGVWNPGPNGLYAAISLERSISLIISFLTVVGGLAFMLYFIFAGIQWTLAGGDQGKVDSAKKQMTNGAIGLIVIVMSYGIIAVVGEVIGLDILSPGTTLINIYKNP